MAAVCRVGRWHRERRACGDPRRKARRKAASARFCAPGAQREKRTAPVSRLFGGDVPGVHRHPAADGAVPAHLRRCGQPH